MNKTFSERLLSFNALMQKIIKILVGWCASSPLFVQGFCFVFFPCFVSLRILEAFFKNGGCHFACVMLKMELGPYNQ